MRGVFEFVCVCMRVWMCVCVCVMFYVALLVSSQPSQYPHELVTYGGNGQVLSNWAQVGTTDWQTHAPDAGMCSHSILPHPETLTSANHHSILPLPLPLTPLSFPFSLLTYPSNCPYHLPPLLPQFWVMMQYLAEMTEDQTLVMYSGHPLGLFPSSPQSPRVVVTNGMVCWYASHPLCEQGKVGNVVMIVRRHAGVDSRMIILDDQTCQRMTCHFKLSLQCNVSPIMGFVCVRMYMDTLNRHVCLPVRLLPGCVLQVVPNYSTTEDYDRMFALGVTMYGQMTAGSYCYIGPQGIVHGTTVGVEGMGAGRGRGGGGREGGREDW